jgi:hypothetical protein
MAHGARPTFGVGCAQEREDEMRKALTALITTSLVLSVGIQAAQAARPFHEGYQSTDVNAFWHSKVKVDNDTYLRITWYAGAYDNAEEGFYSDLYRNVEKCQKRNGPDRCRYQQSLAWYGFTRRTDTNSFTIDKQLTAGHLDATYKLFRSVDNKRVFVGRFHVVADLVGTGDLVRGRSSYTEHEGCTTFKYSGKYAYRQATATGTLTRGDEIARDLGATNDANFGENQFVDISHTC